MENRFTFKDFIFLVMFVLVLSATVFSIYQSSYHETRLNDVKSQLQHVNQEQQQQTILLTDIRNSLRNGVQLSGSPSATQAADNGRIHRTNPDGSTYVYYRDPPKSPRDPQSFADFAFGDWLVQNVDSEPKIVAPYMEKDYSGQQVQLPVLETLLSQNPESFELEPFLAESYQASANGLSFILKLRKNVNFSDGSPITPEDIVFSYKTVKNEKIDDDSLRGYYQHVISCTKIDDRTVEFKMDQPYYQALGYIGSLHIIPERIYKYDNPEEYNKRGQLLVGSGPYVVSRWDSGQQLIMIRNEHYWGERPTFDRLVFKFITNPQAAFQAFQDNQVDYFTPDPDQFFKFSSDTDFLKHFTAHKYLTPLSGYSYIAYNETRPFFKDKLTRQALTMLIDRKSIIHTFLKDIGAETMSPFSPLSPQHDPNLKPWPYDPEGAKQKLAQAGWQTGPDGTLVRDGVRFAFDITIPADYPFGERLATYVKSQFERAGIAARITPWEFKVMIQHQEERNFDVMMLSWMAGSPEDDPYQVWHSDSIKAKGDNYITFINSESDHLIDEARRTLDDAKRMAIWHKWEALIHDQEPYTFVLARMDRLFINGRFRNTLPYKLDKAVYDWYAPAAQQKYH